MAVERIAVDCGGVTTYPTNPQAVIPFSPKSITVISDDNDCYVSLDGVNDHCHLAGSGAAVKFDQHGKSVWLREGAANTHVNVQVIAEV